MLDGITHQIGYDLREAVRIDRSHWHGPFCLVDLQSKDPGQQECIVADEGNMHLWFISDDVKRTTKKLQSLGLKATNDTVLTYRVKTDVRPRPSRGDWPPKTVRDVLAWQGVLDSKCRRKILQRIQEGYEKKSNGVLILVESPVTYGFGVWYKRQDGSTRRVTFPDYGTLIYSLPVMPVSVVRIDDRYLTERNPKMKTFAGKNIAIVGCGTIGSYLSEMLVKAGAGTSGGRLTLVDLDSLYPQNLGRHRLGFPDLFINKAIAMAEELKRLSPGSDVRALPVDVRQAELGEIDLLIDASGEEALGHWLCDRYLPLTPMLSVWIEGSGTAIRALLRKGSSGACYRCLWHSTKRGQLLTVVDSLPVVLAGHGCEGLYVPFPASVSVQAAN